VLVARPDDFCIMFGLGRDRAMLFGIVPPAQRNVTSAPRLQDAPSFAECDVAYWRSPAVRDSLQSGLIQLP
jgi:hypothetical protein